MSLARIWAIAANGFREVIRDRVLYLIGFFALALGIALRLLPEIAATTEEKIFLDLGLAGMGILGVIVAVFVGTGLINKEIEKRTVLVLIPKPLSRAEFIIGKHLGLSGVLAVLVVAMTAIYLLGLRASSIEYPVVSILVSVLYQFLELSLITAVALMFGVFTSSLLATLLTFGIYMMGHLSRDLVELSKLSENPGIERMTETLYLVIPDLSRLNLKNDAVYGVLPPFPELFLNGLYGLLYIVLLLAIAILIFWQREF
ncbi:MULTISPECIES: ABC transporter permease [Moorena]|uniref:ABC-type transport system involved in multi-copper enzyme maturation, permease component n=1 Tax=Moorena producens 3L TaxID=489825 RepID=F4Y294_9CYAN|nr:MULTISPECIES: ABC transporter permease [Moorena]NEQ12765.1 ABC transporter permease [Moorena sp. SIO3E2]EGJ29386.1 ABC-type transport system involved in multi-copper enzyme maturation, permease component [Moorena producens 3L]NEP67772.1 ABC transporter permease [Moorena sp. SIO3A5]NEQ12159.1 ABC transporter permease [Moorena sp. SIO4E2]NER91525.1 ABC transporter permease [Moorena sp. SIO3A2]